MCAQVWIQCAIQIASGKLSKASRVDAAMLADTSCCITP